MLETAFPMTVKVTELLPAGTVTLDGTVTLLLLLESETDAPPVPLGMVAVIVSVPVDSPPPSMVVGEKVSDCTVKGCSVSVPLAIDWFNPAVIVAVISEATAEVRIENETLVLPLATVTDDGTTTFAFELSNATEIPVAGAVPVSVTDPVAIPPETTEPGVMVSEVTLSEEITAPVDLVTDPQVAEMLAVFPAVAVGSPLTVKTTDFDPAGTVTVAGTVTIDVALLASVMTTPPAGAAPVNQTRPVELPPLATAITVGRTSFRVGGLTVRVALFDAPL